MSPPAYDTIAVLDFGGQYAHLIATKLRRMGYRALICDPSEPTEYYKDFKGIILSGSPALESEGSGDSWNTALFEIKKPILGLCYGHQQMSVHYGGQVAHCTKSREYGPATLARTEVDTPIFEGISLESQVFMSHMDSVVKLPEGFVEIASTVHKGVHTHNAAVANPKLQRYGFQFHPEVDDSHEGDKMLGNFAAKVCKAEKTWDMSRFMEEQKIKIKEQCEGKEVFLLASGGVDSTVCAWLLHDAIGPERLHLLHIDNGFMRLNESDAVIKMFKEHDVSRHVNFSDSTQTFLDAIGKHIAPEKKRHIIGNTFIDVFQVEAKKLGLERFLLAQGTIYPDTIESGGTKRSDVIKTHHNRVPIIQKMIDEGKVIEPIADLYKVEVRELGEKLGIPSHMIWRHPFPGPGLGVRLLCADGSSPKQFDREAILAQAGPIVAKFGLKCLPLPVQSVGVKGDLRCYDLPLMLIAEEGYPWKAASEAAVAVFRECHMINRCVLYLGKGVPTTASPVEAYTVRERLDTLKKADDYVMKGLEHHNLYSTVWQCPTVLVPVNVGAEKGELVVIRPVISERAMTAMPFEAPIALCTEWNEKIMALEGVSAVALDLTAKPPGTIEWE